MNKIIMLGTGDGGTINLYNTCFVINNENGNFLVDTGGSIELLNRLSKVNIDYTSLKHIFISHSHTDHILGLFWYFKKVSPYFKQNFNENNFKKLNIYCNDIVYSAIKEVSKHILSEGLMKIIYNSVNFVILNDNDKYVINGVEYTFFDIKGRGTKQFGFECVLNNKKLAFLGDETLNPELYDRFKNYDYCFHEAFCLDDEEKIFHAYEKNHSTTKSVGIVMNKLNIKNLILFHTKDNHPNDKKQLYTEETKKYFKGNIIVPNDLESFEI